MKELYEALIAAQAEIVPPKATETADIKNASGQKLYSYKYASLDALISAVRGPLTKHGLFFMQPNWKSADGKNLLSTVIYHKSGQRIASDPIELMGSTGSCQAYGSALTYMRRYSLATMLGIASEEDNDGKESERNRKPDTSVERGDEESKPSDTKAAPASDNKPITTDALKKLNEVAQSRGLVLDDLLKVASDVVQHDLTTLRDLTQAQGRRVYAAIKAKPQVAQQ